MRNRELQFENEHVSVWKAVIPPNQPFDTHKQSSGQVLIGLKGGELQHKACWLTDAPPHNVSDQPVEIMIVEMKKPKNRPLPAKPID